MICLPSFTKPEGLSIFYEAPNLVSWIRDGFIIRPPYKATIESYISYPVNDSHHCSHMSDCENPRFTERTSTNLGRSHRLPHVCTIMIYGKLGGIACRKLLHLFIYIYIYVWWTINNMWYLGIANVDIGEIWWHNLEKGYHQFGKVPSLTSCF